MKKIYKKIQIILGKNPNLIKIIKNASWLAFDKIFRMGLGLLIIIWLARHLGPEQFGIINYAQAIVALFSSIATLGLSNIVVHDLVKNPKNSNTTLGTAFTLQAFGAIIGIIATIITVKIIKKEETNLIAIATIIALTIAIKPTDVIRYWFESKIQSKYTVIVENIVFMIFSLIKIWFIYKDAELITFAWILFFEALLVGITLIAIYANQSGKISKWKFNIGCAKKLLSDSWPLILSSLASMLYMRIDQIMIGQLLDSKSVGIYSAAVRLSEMWYFIPTIIAASTFPSLIKLREKDTIKYQKNIEHLFKLMTLISIIIGIIVSASSEITITKLYGTEFIDASNVLVVHVWSSIFVFSGVISGRWFIAENLQKYTFYRTLAGCTINIGLNTILIPKYGILGSAWSSVISQSIASIFFNAINKRTRPLFFMQIRSFFFLIPSRGENGK